MLGSRVPRDARGIAVVTLTALAPVVPIAILATNTDRAAEVVRSAQLLTYALVLGAAVYTYFHWRIVSRFAGRVNRRRHAGWLAVGLFVAAGQGLMQSALVGPVTSPDNSWPTLGRIVVLVALIVAIRAAERVEVPGDPGLIGATLGLAISIVSCLGLIFAPRLAVSPASAALLSTTLVLTALVAAWSLLHSRKAARWARARLALALVLLNVAPAVSQLGSESLLVAAVAGLVSMEGALLLCVMAQSMLRRSMLAEERELATLHRTLAQARADVLTGRELLHEIGSTVAGITSASRVMETGIELPPGRRERLEHMVAAELARLERLMSARSEDSERLVDVDAVVRPLVTSHRERGLDVQWSPSRRHAVGDPDDFAQVVNILLENARRHGGRTVRIEVAEAAEYVEVTCSDDGPGIDAAVREHLFESGRRGPDSPGQGLGLSIAQRLMSERGGSLTLADTTFPTTLPGATFVARLPKSELADASSHHCA